MIDRAEFKDRVYGRIQSEVRHILRGDSVVRKVTAPGKLGEELAHRALKAGIDVYRDMTTDAGDRHISGAAVCRELIQSGLMNEIDSALEWASK